MKSVHLNQLAAFYFRNLEAVKFSPHPEMNVFFGRNGHGKTNLLEAISVSTSLKSIRCVKNRDLINFEQEQSHLKATFAGDGHFTVETDIFLQGRKVKIAGKAAKNASSIHQKLALVTFVPDDLHIVTGSASFRRQFLDQAAQGLFPIYAGLYRRFDQTLLRRNRLLKMPAYDPSELDAFNAVFVQTAAPLIRARQATIRILLPQFIQTLAEISGNTITAHLRYESVSTTPDASEETIQSALWQSLEECKKEECLRKTSVVGPHLDDLCITMNAHPARHSASRGQCRAIVLTLKIAQMHCVSEVRQLTPILLLDDVLGELDFQNATRLLETVRAIGSQTFITTTQLELLPNLSRAFHAFEVQNGTIRNPSLDLLEKHTFPRSDHQSDALQ